MYSSAFLDQLTKHQGIDSACNTVIDSLPDELCHTYICLLYTSSEEHEWAKRARAGEKEYQDRYFFFDTYDVPALYEKTCPQVFTTTAPGNFTWLDDLHKHVMTTFYPYQWDCLLYTSRCV